MSGLQAARVGPHDRTKFGYMSYFVEEEGVDMDPNLCERNWLAVTPARAFFLLEGKRLTVGKVWGWQRVIEAAL